MYIKRTSDKRSSSKSKDSKKEKEKKKKEKSGFEEGLDSLKFKVKGVGMMIDNMWVILIIDCKLAKLIYEVGSTLESWKWPCGLVAMIPALGAGGPGFKSRLGPSFAWQKFSFAIRLNLSHSHKLTLNTVLIRTSN